MVDKGLRHAGASQIALLWISEIKQLPRLDILHLRLGGLYLRLLTPEQARY